MTDDDEMPEITDRDTKLIEQIAGLTAAKIAQGLLRMPDDLRAAVKDSGQYGYYSAPGILMPGPNAYYLHALVRSSGIELIIKSADGTDVWRAVLV